MKKKRNLDIESLAWEDVAFYLSQVLGLPDTDMGDAVELSSFLEMNSRVQFVQNGVVFYEDGTSLTLLQLRCLVFNQIRKELGPFRFWKDYVDVMSIPRTHAEASEDASDVQGNENICKRLKVSNF